MQCKYPLRLKQAGRRTGSRADKL